MAIKSRVYFISIVFMVLMLTPFIHLIRYQIVEADKVSSKPNNFRNSENLNLRGRILDRNLQPLAYSHKNERKYTLGESIGSLIGYYSMSLGAAGLEHSFSSITQGFSIPRNPLSAIVQIRKGDAIGDDAVTTIDSYLQRSIYELLGGYRGAAVLMEANSGELLALVSRPSYDPNMVNQKEYWDSLINDNSSPLLERCTQGLYPPGSTFKTVIMAGALEDGLTRVDENFNCVGELEVGHFILNCNARHDNVNLTEALAYSCNVAFATVGTRLGVKNINKWGNIFGFSDNLKGVPGAMTALLGTDSAESSSAEEAIGQSDLLVSPLHMARVASVFANKGKLVEPSLYKGRVRANKFIDKNKNVAGKSIISQQTSNQVGEAMRQVVLIGTGTRASLPNIQVAGKSGSAENPHGDPHAWFICYAPVENPIFVVSVILENAGGGGKYAAPIAGEILRLAFERQNRNI